MPDISAQMPGSPQNTAVTSVLSYYMVVFSNSQVSSFSAPHGPLLSQLGGQNWSKQATLFNFREKIRCCTLLLLRPSGSLLTQQLSVLPPKQGTASPQRTSGNDEDIGVPRARRSCAWAPVGCHTQGLICSNPDVSPGTQEDSGPCQKLCLRGRCDQKLGVTS